jgi:hypothetical protein
MPAPPAPWRCPGCQTFIEHDTVPRPGVVYRCHVCRLELVIDPVTETLVLAPMQT